MSILDQILDNFIYHPNSHRLPVLPKIQTERSKSDFSKDKKHKPNKKYSYFRWNDDGSSEDKGYVHARKAHSVFWSK